MAANDMANPGAGTAYWSVGNGEARWILPLCNPKNGLKEASRDVRLYTMKAAITIPKQVTRGAELLVIPVKEYERLRQQIGELEDALRKIRRGEREFRNGKTRVIRSLAELRR